MVYCLGPLQGANASWAPGRAIGPLKPAKKKTGQRKRKAERRDGEPHGAMRGEQLFDFVYSPWPRLVIVNFTSHQICINAMNGMLMDKSYVSKVQAAPWQTLNFRITLGSKVANKQQAVSDHYVTMRKTLVPQGNLPGTNCKPGDFLCQREEGWN